MPTIGLIAALPQEAGALLRCVQGWERVSLGALRVARFELGGQRCVLATSGMGERRAGEAARMLAATCAPRVLISFGIAGAVEADLRIGDVVAVEAVCRLGRGQTEALFPLAAWPEAARTAAARTLAARLLAGRGARLLAGTAVTTGGAQAAGEQLWGLAHPVLEMETAGIARAAAEMGIPLLALRAISDGPLAPVPFDLGEVMDDDANLQAGRLLMAILRRPGMVLRFGRMLRNARVAEDNAATALAAALGAGL